jgi:NADH-quinone oxidoreductase subunit M
MAETDLIWMSLVVFLPTVFALILLFFPRGKDEAMRWCALFGTALTLGVSLCMFIQFRADTIDFNNLDALSPTYTEAMKQSSLPYRALSSESEPGWSVKKSSDWVSSYPWIPRFNIKYFIGVDGLSVSLILLTTVLSFLAMIASWKIDRFVKGYCILFLVLETGMLGTFVALDFFLFFIFWEVMLLPMYFLIGIWGGPRREYAAIKFFLFTLLGGVFILISLLAFYFTDVRDFVAHDKGGTQFTIVQRGGKLSVEVREPKEEVHTFDLMVLQRIGRAAWQRFNDKPITSTPAVILAQEHVEKLKREVEQARAKTPPVPDELARVREDLARAEAEVPLLIAETTKRVNASQQQFFQPWYQYTFFLLLLIGFAIKVPVFPFHTWLPDAHVEAPTPISMILAGVLLKLGGYGIIRIAYPICPWAGWALAEYVAIFGVINIVYGAFTAMAQTDFKKLVAYSSISHMGFVILGIAVWSRPDRASYWSWGMNGAVFQMLAHGITSAGMFFLVGVIYDRAHHRNLDNFRGLVEPMPLYGGISAVIFFAAMGLPGMCGFVGEFMVALASWNFSPWMSILSYSTVVITAAYILWTVQRVFFGTNPQYRNFSDMSVREIVCITPLVVLSILLGVVPSLVLNWVEPSVSYLVDTLAKF